MQLNIDLGNSKLKWQLQDDSCNFISAVDGILIKDISSISSLWNEHKVDKIKIASVGNAEIFSAIKTWANEKHIEFAHLKTSKCYAGVTNAYGENYSNLGIDRWLNIIAGYKNYGACFVVSCGSALTLDKIDGTGKHLGGFIVPGFNFSLNALKQNANFLHEIEFTKNTNFYGMDTNSCISLGIKKMLQGLLYQAYREQNLPFIVTGGDATLLTHNLQLPYTLVENLIFKGIQIYN